MVLLVKDWDIILTRNAKLSYEGTRNVAIYAISTGKFLNVRVHACVKDLTNIMSVIIVIIIAIIIIIIIFALGLICAVSAGGRTRSHLGWLKSSSRPKSRTHFAFSKFTQIVFCVFATVLPTYCIKKKKVSYICLCNETFCAHKCIFSAQDCNSSADITKSKSSSSRNSFFFTVFCILYELYHVFSP